MKLYKLIFVANAFLLLISICFTNKEITLGKIWMYLTDKSIPIDFLIGFLIVYTLLFQY